MKKILVIVMLIFAFGCSDDVTEPSKDTIVGKWTKEIQSEEGDKIYHLTIEFTKEGKYIAFTDKDIDSKEILIGEYTYINKIITLNDDQCEDMEGKYELEFIGNIVDFKLIKDECDRANYIEGAFVKYTEEVKG